MKLYSYFEPHKSSFYVPCFNIFGFLYHYLSLFLQNMAVSCKLQFIRL